MTAPWTTWSAPAKLNLYLDIRGRRADGYHELRTVFQAIDLADTLRVRRAEGAECSIRVTEGDAPGGEENLIHRAWAALRARKPEVGGVDVELAKRIPIKAGLGGGSSDAAAAIVASAAAWDVDLARAEAEAIAADVGSDPAFFVAGGTQLGEGRGERLTPWPTLRTGVFVVIKPSFGLSTPRVFRAIDLGRLTPPGDALTLLRLGLTREEPQGVAAGVYNALEDAAFSLGPELARLKRKLLGSNGPRSLVSGLSGSGSALFAYVADGAAARAVADDLAADEAVEFVTIAAPRADGVRLVINAS